MGILAIDIALAALGALVVVGLTFVLAGASPRDKQGGTLWAAGSATIVAIALGVGVLIVYALRSATLQ